MTTAAMWRTDRQIVEAMLFPALTLSFLHSQAECQNTDEEKASLQRCIEQCQIALREPINDLDDHRHDKLGRRVMRESEALTDLLDGRAGAHVGLALYYALEELLRSGAIELWEGSAYANAMTEVLESLRAYDGEPRLQAAAQKTARRLLGAMRQRGYFVGGA